MDNRNRVYMLTLTAMFAAILAAASWITLPVPFTPIPINLGTLAVSLAGAFLGYKYGSLSVFIYILLGAVGVPVFAGFTGGIGHIAGPTGGYIAGYVISAFICGLITELTCKERVRWGYVAAAALIGTFCCYVPGTIWFMILTKNNLAASLSMCVIPFIPGDIFKAAAAGFIVTAAKPILDRMAPAGAGETE